MIWILKKRSRDLKKTLILIKLGETEKVIHEEYVRLGKKEKQYINFRAGVKWKKGYKFLDMDSL